jgi:TolA-binding protein
LITLVTASLLSPALAADRVTTERIREIETELTGMGGSVDEVRGNFTERSGLIGVNEARDRYEDALYAYLVNDFDSAATSFYILVQSRALGNADLVRDSEWYLSECLFELKNFRTAAEAYRAIIDKGQSHAYFVDAIRRVLETYAILGDTARFDEVYNQWILSGRVPSTDMINYTLAKSFQRRGEGARAKSLFEGVPTTSEYYSRARYWLGVTMIAEKNYKQALVEFERVVAAPILGPNQQAVNELGTMALARLHYELREHDKAAAEYAKIGRESPLFSAQLYESVWNFVAQERYDDALRQTDVFLLAFPEDQHAAQLKILQGHLHMKTRTYDEARAAYERVVEEYTPIADRLDALSRDDTEVRRFLERMGDTGGTSGLPAFAVELLLARDDVGRVTRAFLTMDQERRQLGDNERLARDLEAALSASGDALSTFVNARNELAGMRGSVLTMHSRLLETEANYLKSRVSSSAKSELADVARDRDEVGASLAETENGESAANDRVQAYEEQVREVQQRAFRVSQVAREAISGARNTSELLASGQSKLPSGEVEGVRQAIDAERGHLAAAVDELDQLQNDVTRKRIMRTVEASAGAQDDAARARALARFAELRRRMGALRRGVQDADAAGTFAQIDRLWDRLGAVEASAAETARIIEAGQIREMTVVRQRLAATSQRLVELRKDLEAQDAATEAMAVRVLGAGLRSARDQFSHDVLLADRGIVDVYWLRKSQTSDDMTTLAEDQSRLLEELDERFWILRESAER